MKSAPCLISNAYGSSDPKIRAFSFWHLAFNLWTPCNHCAAAKRILFWRRNNRQRPIRYSSGKANPAISLFWKRRRQMRKHNFDNRQVLKVSLIDLVSFEHEAIREAILHKIKDFLRNNFINGALGGVWRISQKKIILWRVAFLSAGSIE